MARCRNSEPTDGEQGQRQEAQKVQMSFIKNYPHNIFNLSNHPPYLIYYNLFLQSPWKINVEPGNHLFEKENPLSNIHVWIPCSFQGCIFSRDIERQKFR